MTVLKWEEKKKFKFHPKTELKTNEKYELKPSQFHLHIRIYSLVSRPTIVSRVASAWMLKQSGTRNETCARWIMLNLKKLKQASQSQSLATRKICGTVRRNFISLLYFFHLLSLLPLLLTRHNRISGNVMLCWNHSHRLKEFGETKTNRRVAIVCVKKLLTSADALHFLLLMMLRMVHSYRS